MIVRCCLTVIIALLILLDVYIVNVNSPYVFFLFMESEQDTMESRTSEISFQAVWG